FDLETTGLDASQDMILSLGGVDISCGKIDLKTGVHEYVNGHQEIKAESAVINHILPKMLEEGKQLDEVMDLLFHKMLGKVVLVHGKVVEKSFLDHYVNTHYQLPFLPVVWIDTLCIEKHLTYQQSDGGHDYQLDSLRHKYHLPKYPAHNALIDSIACGELFMAQLSHIFKADKPKVTVGDVYIGK
ncbi:MAG: exonuclease domain-containing protein, partial [Vibrio sp.]